MSYIQEIQELTKKSRIKIEQQEKAALKKYISVVEDAIKSAAEDGLEYVDISLSPYCDTSEVYHIVNKLVVYFRKEGFVCNADDECLKIQWGGIIALF